MEWISNKLHNFHEDPINKVYAEVGVNSSYVKVMDNGSGISRDELVVLMGEPYATSKVNHLVMMNYVNVEFDFHGKTLCSIANVSLLAIVTKAGGKPKGSLFIVLTNNKTIKLRNVTDHKVKSVQKMDSKRSVSSENSLLVEKTIKSSQS